jgi:hypothetical protein
MAREDRSTEIQATWERSIALMIKVSRLSDGDKWVIAT